MNKIILTIFILASAMSWAITFEDAADIVVNDLLNGDTDGVRVYGLENALDGGTTVRAWHDTIKTPTTGYLFLVDPAPLANWEHDCTWIFVGSASGEVSNYKMTTPPRDETYLEMVEITDPALYSYDTTYEEIRKSIRDRQNEIFGADYYQIDRSQLKGNRYALLISGGANTGNNHIRYWGDMAFIYRTLVNYYGYDPSEIEICMSDGDNPAVDRSNGTSSPTDLDGDGQPDYTKDATRTTVMDELQTLVDNVAAGDQVFVFTTDHGGGGGTGDEDVYLNLWNSTQLEDDEFATYMHNLPSSVVKIICMEQCFSGGFIDDIEDNGTDNVVMSTAAGYWESSWAGDTYPEFDEFVYEWTAAVNWAYDDIYGPPTPVDADTDSSGSCEIDEAHIWAVDHDDASESPQWFDSDSIGDSVTLLGDISGVMVTFQGIEHEDPAPGGNGDGMYVIGETVEVTVTAGNLGQTTATGLTATLTTSDSDLTIVNGSSSMPDIPNGGSSSNTTVLTFSVDSSLTENRYAELTVTITGDGGVNKSKTFDVVIIESISDYGFADNMESGGGDWTTEGTGQWHISSWNPYEGSQCWRCGDTGSSGHNDNIDQSIVTPLVFLEPTKTSGEFSYYTKFGLEVSYDYGYCDINDGSGWTTLNTYNGGDSSGGSWISETQDITAYAGSLVQGRFRMTSDGSQQRYGMDIDLVDLGSEGTTDIDVYNFLALFEQGNVFVQWSSADSDVLGYNLYRRESDVPESVLTSGDDSVMVATTTTNNDWECLNDTLITGVSPYRFTDDTVDIDKTYQYRLEAVLIGDKEEIGTRSVSTAESNIPFTYRLGQSYPNPSANMAYIDFALPRTENVTLKLYDMKGRCVATPADGELTIGIHSIPVDVSTLASGVYLYRLETPNFNEVMKLVVGR